VRATRWEHFRRRLGGRVAGYGSIFAIALGLAIATENHDALGGMTAALAVLLLVMLVLWRRASDEAEGDGRGGLDPRDEAER
jgi:MYXO-CTERM domain-containing protein